MERSRVIQVETTDLAESFIPLAWSNRCRYNKTHMKNHFRLYVGIVHPPSPETMSMPAEEDERSSAATADSACASCRADEPYEAPKRFFFAKYLTCFASKELILRSNMRKQHCEEDRKFWSEVGLLKRVTVMAVGLHFLIVLGPNVFAQDQSVENNVFDPIKFQMKSIAEENTALVKKNKTLKVQLIGLQLEVEREERVIKDLDPEYTVKAQYSREQDRPLAIESTSREELEDSAIREEAQELFLSGQYMDLNEEQRLKELQLYDLQYQKQELKLDLLERQALVQEFQGQRDKEFQGVEKDIKESIREEKDMRRKVAGAEKRMLAYPQDIDLLKMENEALRKNIKHLRKLLSQ